MNGNKVKINRYGSKARKGILSNSKLMPDLFRNILQHH